MEVRIQKQWVTFRLDTGADVISRRNIMAEVGGAKIEDVYRTLRNASGRLMNFKGAFTTFISYRGYEVPVKLYVGHGTGSILWEFLVKGI